MGMAMAMGMHATSAGAAALPAMYPTPPAAAAPHYALQSPTAAAMSSMSSQTMIAVQAATIAPPTQNVQLPGAMPGVPNGLPSLSPTCSGQGQQVGCGGMLMSPGGSSLCTLPSPGPSISLLDVNSPHGLDGLALDALPVTGNPTVSSPEAAEGEDEDDPLMAGGLGGMDGMDLPFDFVHGLSSMASEDLGLPMAGDDFKDDLWHQVFNQTMLGSMPTAAAAAAGSDA